MVPGRIEDEPCTCARAMGYTRAYEATAWSDVSLHVLAQTLLSQPSLRVPSDPTLRVRPVDNSAPFRLTLATPDGQLGALLSSGRSHTSKPTYFPNFALFLSPS